MDQAGAKARKVQANRDDGETACEHLDLPQNVPPRSVETGERSSRPRGSTECAHFMAIEIERRFLVRGSCRTIEVGAASQLHIVQGYFGRVDQLRVRVRIARDENGRARAFLTFKGPRHGICRQEFEYPIAIERADCALRTLSPEHIIRKTRYFVPGSNNLTWSVDYFEGRNKGLVIAEMELEHPDQKIALPPWIGPEVTFNSRYGNSRLARHGPPRIPSSAEDPLADFFVHHDAAAAIRGTGENRTEIRAR